MTEKPITATLYTWRDPKDIPSRTETIRRLNEENAYLREALTAARAALGEEEDTKQMDRFKIYSPSELSELFNGVQIGSLTDLDRILRDMTVYFPEHMHGSSPKEYTDAIWDRVVALETALTKLFKVSRYVANDYVEYISESKENGANAEWVAYARERLAKFEAAIDVAEQLIHD